MDKHYDYQFYEKKLSDLWENNKIFKTENNPGPLYSIDTPPPTVSGGLHIGHIFSYTQTDIIARYKRMNGFSVFYPFGFDDNGLPTERYVEKKRKIRAHTLTRSAFIELCLKETKEVEKSFKNLWQQIGLSVDWDLCYSTISEPVRKLSQESFLRLFKKGFIYRKQEPALYCTTCRTSVAQAELEDKEIESFFNNIIFFDEHGNKLIVGTTRPELLPSCVALFYHPSDKRYQHLKNKMARVPIFNTLVPILEDELVEIDKGTGLVMCCTFGDKTDVLWQKKHTLPYKQSIGSNGKFLPQTGALAHLSVKEARSKAIQELITQQLLVSQKPIIHPVNVHERCKNEIEFIVLPQWFITILDHKKKFLEIGEQIEWFPSFMKARYKDWVDHISWDWCISRQRFFGIPFPVWHCQDCNKILLPDISQLPLDPQETPFQGSCPQCSGTNIIPDTDVMDTWNTSSLSPYICYTLYNQTHISPFEDTLLDNFVPMSMRPQAHDIIRTWAFYTIVKTWMHHQTEPWKNIVISGHVLSDAKEKLSKSKNNTILEPENLLKRYAADAIRYWTASGSLGQDISFSENQLKIGQRLITKLWNAFRFIKDHTANSLQPPDNFGTVNEWLLQTASTCFTNYQTHLEDNEFGLALNDIETFFWKNFCDNYLEIIKNQLFHPENYDQQTIEATRWTLYNVGLRILQMYAPYMPYITDTLYQLIYHQNDIPSVHQTKFKDIQHPYNFEQSILITETLLDLITHIRKLKTEHQLSLKTELASLTIYTDLETASQIKEHEQLFKGVTNTQTIVYKTEKQKKSGLKEKDGSWHGTLSY